jgi:hypothetical protein
MAANGIYARMYRLQGRSLEQDVPVSTLFSER